LRTDKTSRSPLKQLDGRCRRAGFNGTVSDVNVGLGRLKVPVNIFDRETPAELGFDQVAEV
jgi:hypothetical protein